MERKFNHELDTFGRWAKDGPRTTISADAYPAGQSRALPLTRKLDRYLKSIPVIAFGITIAASWEATANGFQAGLLNGGPSSLIWGFLVAGPGTAAIVLSLAEMASVTPSVGAQYRWVAIYSPNFLPRRFLSFFQGWLTVFAWIASATVLPYFAASQICGLLILNYDSYVYQGWHVTLIGYATVLIPLVFNVYARKTLKYIEIFAVILHFTFFVAVVVVLVTLGGRNSAEYVFTGNSGGVSGWKSEPIQWCIGLLSAAFPLAIFDGVLHLSDEVKNPQIRVPKSMVISWVINAVSAFGFMIVLLFFMGDPEEALNSKTFWPIIQICYQAARNLHGANALMAMVIMPTIIAMFNTFASVTRLAWAFARDDGLPFSTYFKEVHPTRRMPLHALGITTLISMLLLLIPIGSEVAFNAIVSLSLLSLYISYTLPCLFIFLKRVTGEEVIESAWSLGRWGVWINGFAAVYGIFMCIFLCFPTQLPVTVANMNWAGPIVGFVTLFSMADWIFRARFKFAVPLEKKEDLDEYIGD